MKVTFFLPAGMVEWAVPPDVRETFSFPALVGKIRSDGYFMAPDLYFQHAAIVGMLYSSDGVAPSSTVQGMTKQ